MRLFENLKARILKSIITWSVMGQQNAQAKKVYSINLLASWNVHILTVQFTKKAGRKQSVKYNNKSNATKSRNNLLYVSW